MLAGELTDLGKTEEGLALARSLIVNAPSDRTVWLALGQMYVRQHRWKDADDSYAKAEPLSTGKDDRIYLLFLKGELADRHIEVSIDRVPFDDVRAF